MEICKKYSNCGAPDLLVFLSLCRSRFRDQDDCAEAVDALQGLEKEDTLIDGGSSITFIHKAYGLLERFVLR